MFFKYFLALSATLFLGPGVGHLFLRQHKKAFILIGICLFFVTVTAVAVMLSADMSNVPKDYESMNIFFKELLRENMKMMLIIDIPVAGAWAYAILDILRHAFSEYKEKMKNEE